MDIEIVDWPLPEATWSILIKEAVAESIIYVNAGDRPTRQQFHIAHELGHCILHPAGIYTYGKGSDKYEREANIAAAEILMPETEVERVVKRQGLAPAVLARTFGVSRQAMRIRLEELGLVRGAFLALLG